LTIKVPNYRLEQKFVIYRKSTVQKSRFLDDLNILSELLEDVLDLTMFPKNIVEKIRVTDLCEKKQEFCSFSTATTPK
jgi:hypothetical protein